MIQGSIAVLVLCIAVGTVQGQGLGGGSETDDCAIITVIHRDNPVSLSRVRNSLSTAVATSNLGSQASRRKDYTLSPELSFASLVDPDCGCIRDTYLEAELRVPHSTTKITSIRLLDYKGKTVAVATIPEEQQTNFVLDGSTLLTRVHVAIDQSSALSARYTRVKYVRVTRGGDKGLNNIDPADRDEVWWQVAGLRLRRGCKECGAVPGSYRGDNALVPLTTSGEHIPLMGASTQLSLGPIDLRNMVDPSCRCLSPGYGTHAAASISMYTVIRDRNVFPGSVELRGPDGTLLWTGAATRPEVDQVGEWQHLTFRIVGSGNAWVVAPESAGGHGTLPPWDQVTVHLTRTSLTGTPSAAQVPTVRDIALVTGAPTVDGAYAAYLRMQPVLLNATGGSGNDAGTMEEAASAATVSATRWRELTTVLNTTMLEAAAVDGDCGDPTCGHNHVVLDVAAWSGSNPSSRVSLGAVHFVDIRGREASVTVPSAQVDTQVAAGDGDIVTLWLPMTPAYVNSTMGFNWTAVTGVRFTVAGTPPIGVAAALAAGQLRVSELRVAVPQRVGYVSQPETYIDEDMACDALVGSVDSSPFARHDAVKFGHCRACCCYLDDTSTDPVSKFCYDHGDVVADVAPNPLMAPNDQCAVCNRYVNPVIMTPANDLLPADADPAHYTCDDGDACTYNDRCTDLGACIGDTYTTCLDDPDDPANNCEVCDGTGPDSPTFGCTAAPGSFVYQPESDSRVCGCMVDGVVYPHLTEAPGLPCQRCDVTQSTTSWSNLVDGVVCNPTEQHDWANLPSQACSYEFVCTSGECLGTGYTCPPLQACEAPVDEFPNVCDMTGPGSDTGGCQRRTLEAGAVCAVQVHGCMPQSECTGETGACPPQTELPGIIYSDADMALRLLLPDGSDADTSYPVMPSLDSISVSFDSFRVECGDLALRVAAIPAGQCLTSRVSDEVGGGWGTDYPVAPRGRFALRTRSVALHYEPGTQATTPGDDSDVAAAAPPALPDVDATLLRLDPHVELPDYFGTDGVPEPFLDVVMRKESWAQLTGAQLVDASNNTVAFTFPRTRITGAWTVASGPGRQLGGGNSFEWANIVGVRLQRDGVATVDGIARGGHLFTVQSVTLRSRAQGPPCARLQLSGDDTSAVAAALNTTEGVGAAYDATLPAAVDVSSVYDTVQNVIVSDAVLSLEVRGPVAGFAPTEVALVFADGQRVVASGAAGATSMPHAYADGSTEWVRVLVPLRAGQLSDGVSDTTFAAAVAVQVRFDDEVLSLGGAGVAVRSVFITVAGRCAHATASLLNGGLDVFAATSVAPPLVMEAVADSTSLSAVRSAGLSVGSANFDLDLGSLYDESCDCFPGAVLQLSVTTADPFVRLTRLDLVEVASGHGLSLELPEPVLAPLSAAEVSQNPGGPRSGVVSVAMDGDGATVFGPPSSWSSVNVMRMWRSLPAEATNVGDITITSVRVRRGTVPCITSTSTVKAGTTPPGGAVLTSPGDEIVFAATDGSHAELVRVPAHHAGAGASTFAPSQQAGAWVEGSRDGDSAFSAIADVPRAAGTGSVAVAVGSVSGTNPSFADVTLAADGASVAAVGVVSARDVATGTGAWALTLGAGAKPFAVSAAVAPAAWSGGEAQAVAVVVGRIAGTTANVAPMLMPGGATASGTAGGATDAFALVLDATTGAQLAAAVVGSAGDDTWSSVAHGSAGSGAAAVVVGGHSTGRPAALGLPASDLVSASARVCLVASYASAAALGDGMAPQWARALGHDADAVVCGIDAVGVSAASAAADASAIVAVAGRYSGGQLNASTSAEASHLPAPPAGEARTFVGALSAATGELMWASAVPGAASNGAAALLATPGQVTVCATTDSASSSLSAYDAASGELVWSVALPGATCTGLALGGGGGAADVAVTVTSSSGRAFEVQSTLSNVTVDGGWVPGSAHSVLLRLDLASGVVVGFEAFGTNGTATSAAAVAATRDGTGVVVAGATVGGISFGSPMPVATYGSAPSGNLTSAFTAKFLAPMRGATALPSTLARDGGMGDERGTSIATLDHVHVVAGAVAGSASGPARVGGVDVADTGVAGSADELGSLQFLTRGGRSGVVATSVLDSEWRVTGTSRWAAVAAASGATVLAAGDVHGVRGDGAYLSVPGGDRIQRLAYPESREPVLAAFSGAGQPLWTVSSIAAGSTAGDDWVTALAFDGATATAVVGGVTDAPTLYTCGNDYGAFGAVLEGSDLGDACTTGRVTLLQLGDGVSAAPTATTTTWFGGDGVSASVSAVTVGGGSIVVTGTLMRGATEYAPSYVAEGSLYVPDSLWGAVSAVNATAAGAGVTISPPARGASSSWVAEYDARTGALLWASSVASGDTTSADVAATAVAATAGDVLVCGSVHVRGAATTALRVSTSASVPGTGDSSAAAVLPDADASWHGYAASSTSPVFVMALDNADGHVRWVKWVDADGGSAVCAALLPQPATASVLVVGSTTPDSEALLASGASQLPLGNAAGTWVARLSARTGAVASIVAAASSVVPGSAVDADAATTRDTVAGATMDHDLGAVLLVGATRGGPLRVASAALGDGTLPGGASVADNSVLGADGSWDLVVRAFPLPEVGARAETEGVLLAGLGVAVSSPAGDQAVGPAPGITAPTEVGLGFATGVSVGNLHTVTAGYFKGTLALDGVGGSHTVTSLGKLGVPLDAFNSLLTFYGGAGAGLSVAASLTMVIDGQDSATDSRFRAVATSSDGAWHVVAGHATAPLASTPAEVAGVVTTLPGDGGRDGFVMVVSDATRDVQWLLPVGAVAAGDDALVAVAVHDNVVVAGGSVTGAVPSFGATTVYIPAIESRTLATAFVSGLGVGAQRWGVAFGTDATDGVAQTTAVGIHAGTGNIIVAGTFAGGSLVLEGASGTVPLAPSVATVGGGDDPTTGFVALLNATNGAVLWATASRHGEHATAASFAVPRGLAVSDVAVVVTGEFSAPGTALLGWSAADELDVDGGDVVAKATLSSGQNAAPHGFMSVLDVSTGSVLRLDVPECPSGCRAGGVSTSDGRAHVAYTYTGWAAFGEHVVSDPVAPSAHRAAVVVYGTSDVESVQVLSPTGSGNADAFCVGVGRHGSTVAVGGWRAGALALPPMDAPGGDAGAAAAPERAVTGESVEYMPFVATFGPMTRVAAGDAVVTNVATGRVNVGSVGSGPDALAGTVQHVSVALGLTTTLTAATFTGASLNVSGTGAAFANGHTTSADAVLVATDRRSGAPRWALPVTTSAADTADSIAGVAGDPDGAALCVAATVVDGSVELFGHEAVAPQDGGGASDAVLACFDDGATPLGEAPRPRWVLPIGSAVEQAATAVTVSRGLAWLALTTVGALNIGSSSVAHGGDGEPLCVVAAVGLGSGTPVGVLTFGGETVSDACKVTALAVSADGSIVFTAGTFIGSSLPLPGRTLTATHAAHATPFVAAWDASGGGAGPFQLRWASSATYDGSSYEPATAFGSVTGLALAPASAALRADGGAALFVTGLYYTPSMAWGAAGTASASALLTGSGDPVTGYVAAFHADAGTIGGAEAANADWASSIDSASRAGIQANGGVVLARGGRVGVAITSTAAVTTSHALPPSSAPDGVASFATLAWLVGHSGALDGGVSLADASPSTAAAAPSQVARLHVTTAAGAGASATAARGLVVAGAAVGGVSPLWRGAATSAGANGVDTFSLFTAALDAAAGHTDARAPLLSTDASGADLGKSDYVVQMDVWREAGAGTISGGEWRSGPATGPGVTFTVSGSQLEAQEARGAGRWMTIDGAASLVRGAAGRSAFGATGGASLLSGLQALTLRSGPVLVDSAARWRVRNVRLAPRDPVCVPCGWVPVAQEPVELVRDPLPASAAGGLVGLSSADGFTMPPIAVDASTIVDPSCACLRGVQVVWEERDREVGSTAIGELDAIVVGVTLGNADASAGATSFSVSYTPLGPGTRDADGYGWREGVADIEITDHNRAADMDWGAITTVRFLSVVPTVASNSVPAASLHVRRVRLQRACGLADSVLHPYPTEVGSQAAVSRSGLNLTHGTSYRLIGYATNMWGDAAAPVCSAQFVADNTPPAVSSASVRDIQPTIGADTDVDIDFTHHTKLRVGWSGSFDEAESAPDDILLFRIVNVTMYEPAGPQVEDVTTEENLLAAADPAGLVTTGELDLEDGVLYFVHLGVCNRGKLCNVVASHDGVVHDSSPPESPAMLIVDSPSVVVPNDAPAVFSHHQTNDDSIHVSWAPFADPHTWTTDLRVGLGTAEFGTDVVELELVANDTTSHSFGPFADATALVKGQVYYVVFSATNVAGAQAFYRTAPLYVDITPPVAQYAYDLFPGLLASSDTSDTDLTDGSRVRARFLCDDPESVEGGLRGTMTYSWRVCNTAACDDTVYADWMDVGAETTVATNTSVLAAAIDAGTLTWVYVQVECTNPAGLSTVLSSNGAFFDDTPPNNASAVVAEIDQTPGASSSPLLGDVDYISTTTLAASWLGFFTEDGKPPLHHYEFGVGTEPCEADVVPMRNVNLATEAETSGADAQLVHGRTYYVTVAAVTTAGASSYVCSDGVSVDLYPPEFRMVDLVADFLEVNDTTRCASHLQCMEVTERPGQDIDYVPSTEVASFTAANLTTVGQLQVLAFGASTCGADVLNLNLVPYTVVPPTQTRYDSTRVQMFHGQQYCTLAFATSAAGLSSYNVSDGFVVDLSPPVPVLVHEGSSAQVDEDAASTPTALNVTVLCADPESGIHHIEVRFALVDFATGVEVEEVMPWAIIPNSFSPPSVSGTPVTAEIGGLDLEHASWYVTSARCVNGAGAFEDLDSDGITLDETAADTSGATVAHSLHRVDVTFQAESGTLVASWDGFVDPESRIVSFSWSIGTTAHGTDIVPITALGPVTTATAGPGLGLEDGTTYYVTAYATNAAGLTSSTASGGVTVDASAPEAPDFVRLVRAPTDASPRGTGGWIGATDRLRVSWAAAAEPHSVATYRWSLGTARHGQQLVSWTDAGTTVEANATGLALLPGMPYFFTVEATNEAGLRTVVVSEELGVDPYPPVAGTVVDGTSMVTAVLGQTSTSTLDCAWSGFSDSLSGIQSYHVGFGTTRGAADTVPFTTLTASTDSYTATSLTLSPGTVYHCVVVAYDMAGNAVQVTSPGVVVDVTGPEIDEVMDVAPGALLGSGASDVDAVTAEDGAVTTIAGSWPRWHDDESGIIRVEWSVGTTAGAADLWPWVSVPDHHAGSIVTLPTPLGVGDSYYVSSRAYNGAGTVTTVHSDGVTIVAPAGEDVGPALDVYARVLYVPASPNGTSWCHCGDPNGALAASGAVYDPSTGACSCGPDLYLDYAAGEDRTATGLVELTCTACPAGTCKRVLGNSRTLCTADACSDPEVPVPEAPAVTGLTPCGVPGLGLVLRADGACTCPAGTRSEPMTGRCVPCEAGTVNPYMANVSSCGTCWAPLIPDAVLEVRWDTAALEAGGLVPTGIEVAVGSSAGAMRWTRSADPADDAVEFYSRENRHLSPPFRQGAALNMRVRATADGGASVMSDIRQLAPVVDFSPPIGGGINDGTNGFMTDTDVSLTGASFSAGWFDFVDPEWVDYLGAYDYGICEFHVAFGTGNGALADISNGWTTVSGASATAAYKSTATLPPGSELSDATWVYATVRAFTCGGSWSQLTSDGVVVGSIVPDGAVAVVTADMAEAGLRGGDGGSIKHIPGQRSDTDVGAVWQFPEWDPPMPLTYEWAIRDVASSTYALPFTSVGDATWASVRGLSPPLQAGRRYVVRVRAANTAGAVVISESPPVLIDASDPTANVNVVAADGAVATASGIVFQRGDTVGVEWECVDDVAAPENVTVAVGSVVGGEQALARVVVPYGTKSASFAGLDLAHGHCYVAHVSCTTDAGRSSPYAVSSPVCADQTAPRAQVTLSHPAVAAATAAVIASEDDDNAAAAADAAFAEVVAASSAHPQAPWGTVDASHLALATPLLRTWLSHRADTDDIAVAAHLSLRPTLRVQASDFESGVQDLSVSWSTAQPGASPADVAAAAVVPLEDVSTSALDLLGSAVVVTNDTVAQLAAAAGGGNAGATLHPRWTVRNNAGGVETVTSAAPFVLDVTPPHGSVGDAALTYQASTTSIHCTWAFADEESGVAGYVWSVLKEDTGATVVSPSWAGSALEATAEGLTLAPGTYTLRVTACNGALHCRTVEGRRRVDVTAPVNGTIYLGAPDAGRVAELCASDSGVCSLPPPVNMPSGGLAALGDVSWGGFGDPDSPVTGYTVALGTSGAGTQLGQPLHLGADVESASLAELGLADADAIEAQLYDGAMLFVSVSATNAAGVTATVVAPVFTVDRLAPYPGAVVLAGLPPATKVREIPAPNTTVKLALPASAGAESAPYVVQLSDADATVTWSEFADVQAGSVNVSTAVEYEASLLDSVTGARVAGPTTVAAGSLLMVRWDGLSLVPARLYTAAVTGVDEAGNRLTSRSVWGLLVDATPPATVEVDDAGYGVVHDGLEAWQDLDCQPHAGVEPMPEAEVVTIDARRGPGNVTVVTELPTAVLDEEGFVDVDAAPLTAPTDATIIQFHAPPFHDAESGVAEVYAAIGTTAGDADVLDWTRIPTQATAVQVVLPRLSEGAVAYVSVRARNAVGLEGEARADGVRMLCQPGTAGCPYDGDFVCVSL